MSDFTILSVKQLIAARATGPDLDAQTHLDIKSALKSRGVVPPPIPSEPIYIDSPIFGTSTSASWGRDLLILLAVLLSAAITKAAVNTWVAAAVIVGGLAWTIHSRVRRIAARKKDSSDPDSFDAAAKALGLDEVMRAAALNKLPRLRDLLNYDQPVSTTDADGFTALMYASKNGHTDCVELLLERGADPNRKTPKGSTSLSLAEQQGHHAISAMLEASLTRNTSSASGTRSPSEAK